MKNSRAVILLVSLVAFGGACATETASQRTWSAPGAAPVSERSGQVQSIQEIVHHFEGNPAGGALAGALIGGILFGGRGPAAVMGAVGGAAVGAAVGANASQGAWERRSYHVLVRFDDGDYGMFVYDGYSPFQPGEYVVLTPQGLARR